MNEYDINDFEVTGRVVSISTGEDYSKIPFTNVRIESIRRKKEIIPCSFYSDIALRFAKDVKEGDRVFIHAAIRGSDVKETLKMRVVGDNFFIIKD